MLNQIYMNDTQFNSLINAIGGGGGGGGTLPFDIVNIPSSSFTWQPSLYLHKAPIPSGINDSDIIGILCFVREQVTMAVPSIYNGDIYIQIYSPYNDNKGDGSEDLECNLLVLNNGGV